MGPGAETLQGLPPGDGTDHRLCPLCVQGEGTQDPPATDILHAINIHPTDLVFYIYIYIERERERERDLVHRMIKNVYKCYACLERP